MSDQQPAVQSLPEPLTPESRGSLPLSGGAARAWSRTAPYALALFTTLVLAALATFVIAQGRLRAHQTADAVGRGIDAPASSLGRTAPDFTVKLYTGDSFRLSAQRGHPVVVNFWASWCVPCRSEMPAFERTFRAYGKRGVVFVGLAVNDDPAASRAFLKELAITYPIGPDEGSRITDAYQVFGLPTSIFITSQGTVARKHTGEMTEQQLVDSLKRIAP